MTETDSVRETVYVEDTPKRMAARHIGADDGRCQYQYFGINARCSNDAVAHTFMEFEGEQRVVEMCAKHAREDVPEQPTEQQGKLVTDGGLRTPTHCPHCGYDGVFDGHGKFTRKLATSTLQGDGYVETHESWDKIRCPDCGNKFALLNKTVRIEHDEDGNEVDKPHELVTDGGVDQPGIERCDPADLAPSRAHVRREHSDPGDQLVESVSNVGIVTPPIGRVEDSEIRLIDGVRRAKAAAEAGIEEIPVVVRDLDDADAKCQSLTLNDAEAGIEKEVVEQDREKSLGRLQDRTGLDREEIEAEIGLLSNAERISRELADVPGVGRKTAERIADHYDYEDLVEKPDGYESGCWAPDTPLSAIDGVGKQTAGAIRRHLWGEIHA